jgi:hypothetical protein
MDCLSNRRFLDYIGERVETGLALSGG